MNIYNEICKYPSIFYHILHLLCNIVNILYRINFPRAPLLPRRAPSDSADNLHLGARVHKKRITTLFDKKHCHSLQNKKLCEKKW